MKKEDRLHIRVDGDLADFLKREAAKKRTTISEVARQFLYEKFDARKRK